MTFILIVSDSSLVFRNFYSSDSEVEFINEAPSSTNPTTNQSLTSQEMGKEDFALVGSTSLTVVYWQYIVFKANMNFINRILEAFTNWADSWSKATPELGLWTGTWRSQRNDSWEVSRHTSPKERVSVSRSIFLDNIYLFQL